MGVARRYSLLVLLLLTGLVSFSCKKKFDPENRIASGDVPSGTELEQYVSGAGSVRLAMTEDEVSTVLGRPSRRGDATSQDEFADVAWDNIGGAHPGVALGHFKAGKLYAIEFATASTAMPHVTADAARSLETADVVRRSVARTLRIEDVEAVTGSRGLRVRWVFGLRPPDRANVRSVWAWEVEPGGRALLVDDENGLAGQPVVRDLKR